MAKRRNYRPKVEKLAKREMPSASVHMEASKASGGFAITFTNCEASNTEISIHFRQAEFGSRGRVFVVHGRNERVRESVARFLENLGLSVTILHEQANRGRTIIEKFEDHTDVGFAVVLLTGDDRGGLAETPPNDFRPRARQNVILELGYFISRIGRDRVCALYEPDVEVPSDFSGVLLLELDANRRWQVELARELRAVGFDVDLNMLIK